MPRTRTLSDDVVLERATSVFWRNGYSATSLRHLTQATGLSNAALYHRYAHKDGLFVEVLCRYADTGLVERLARLSALPDPFEAIRDFLDELVAMSLADPERRGCLLVNTALDGASMTDTARQVVRTRLGDVETFFGALLGRAVADGALDPETDIQAGATALLGTVFAIRVLARLDPDPKRLRALSEHAMSSVRPPHSPQPARQMA